MPFKFIPNSLPLLLSGSLFFAAADSHALRPQAQIEASGTIRFCNIVWFGESDKTTRLGPEVELAHELGKFLKLKSASVVVLWDDFFKNSDGKVEKELAYEPDFLASSKCDFYAANMTVNEWRQSKLTIVPYHAGRIMVVVRKEDAGKIQKLEDLKGKRTIVTANTTLQAELEKVNLQPGSSEKRFEIQITKNGGTDKALLSKEVDFIALDTSQALQLILKSGNKVRIAFPIGDNQSIGWGFPKNALWLQKRFTEFIDSQKREEHSRLNQIFSSYYGVSLNGYREIVQNAQRSQ